MLYKHIIALAATLLAFSNPTIAATRKADLIAYFNSDCTGALLGCTNFPPSTCCAQPKNPKYKGHKCNGCDANDTHGVYKKAKTNLCGTACNAASGQRCAACAAPVGGAAWFANAGKRDSMPSPTEQGLENEVRDAALPSCTATVEPDIFSKDQITYFKINHDVPPEITDAILEWGMDSNATLADLPSEAFKYEIHDFPGFSFN